MTGIIRTSRIIDRAALPNRFPTHRHDSAFWEELGRAVACFGFLEEILLRAIFAITGTTECNSEEKEAAYESWLQKLDSSLSDPLGKLIDTYTSAINNNSACIVQDQDRLLKDLRLASVIRNTICHGSWPPPNTAGASTPFFINNKKEVFATEIDVKYLQKVQEEVSNLACDVMDTVTKMGWQFPGSSGPGEVVWKSVVNQDT